MVSYKSVPEHRVVMEQYLGRKLTSNEVVHHIDGNKRNNEISNLRLMTQQEHSRLHNGRKETRVIVCPHCRGSIKIHKGLFKKGDKTEKIYEVVRASRDELRKEALLQRLRDGKIPADIAKELNVTRQALTPLLRDLKRERKIRHKSYGVWEVLA